LNVSISSRIFARVPPVLRDQLELVNIVRDGATADADARLHHRQPWPSGQTGSNVIMPN